MRSRDSSARAFWTRALVVRLLVVAVTVVAALVSGFRLRLDPNVASLVPERRDHGALALYLRAFGGGGIAVVLVESDTPEVTRAVADRLEQDLRARPSVALASARVPIAETAPDPLLLFRQADAATRAALAAALTPEGLRERLATTRSLLLAPGASSVAERLRQDPLRLYEIAYGGTKQANAPAADGTFSSEDGLAALVFVKPRGQALSSADAKAFVADVRAVVAPVSQDNPSARIGLTGPHAVAGEMEALLRADLVRSGILSTVLASLAFAAVFRRIRALVAILPPLLVGTLWTTTLGALFPSGLSAIAVAFASVVVGVGFDAGVHVYSALLEARREGLDGRAAAAAARAHTARPVLVAAVIAGAAFSSLALSDIEALAQLGLLCGAGEVLTAIAIVLITPEIGALIERGAPPERAGAGLLRAVARLTATRARAAIVLATVAVVAIASLVARPWRPADALVSVRPDGLPSLLVEERIFERFGGRSQPFVVLVQGTDRDETMARADRISERLLSEGVSRVEGLATILPAEATQRARLAERDRLDLPAIGRDAAVALREVGFSASKLDGFVKSFEAPSHDLVDVTRALETPLSVLATRHLATYEGKTFASVHFHLDDPGNDALARVERAVHEEDPGAAITGYARLESDLRLALASDLPRIGGVAGLAVVVLLFAAFRRAREVILASVAVVLGIVLLLGLLVVLHVPLHIYSALVIPVLLGISVDEAMFVLHRARALEAASGGDDVIAEALQKEGRNVLATSLTTSAGFGALALSSYPGLVDLGKVGALGSLSTLVMALCVVPAGLRLFVRARR